MNGIQVTKPAGRQCNRLIYAVVTKKITIDHAIYIKVFTDVTVYYLRVSNDDVLNTTNNETEFNEPRRVLKNPLRLKSRKDMSLNTQISEFASILLVLVLIRLITS